MTTKTISLVGASGRLGALIADEILRTPRTRLRLLVRAESRDKVAGLEARGAQVVEGDITSNDPATLDEFVDGATTVISAVQGGPDALVEGQAALLLAARRAGVRRFIPSTFSLNMFGVASGQILTSDLRLAFAEIADAERGEVEVSHVMIGGFLDRDVMFGFMRIVDLENRTAYYWGDGDRAMDFTTYADTARYTAALALDERPAPRVYAAAGDTKNFHELVHNFEEASGDTLKVERLGSLDDLDHRIDELQQGGQANFLKFLPLMYYRAQLNGNGKLDPLMNDRYPDITPLTISDYVRIENL